MSVVEWGCLFACVLLWFRMRGNASDFFQMQLSNLQLLQSQIKVSPESLIFQDVLRIYMI